MGAWNTYGGYPALAPDGLPWTLGKAIRAYGVPVPRPVIEMCNRRTRAQVEREADEMRARSLRNWASFRRLVEHGAIAEEEPHG